MRTAIVNYHGLAQPSPPMQVSRPYAASRRTGPTPLLTERQTQVIRLLQSGVCHIKPLSERMLVTHGSMKEMMVAIYRRLQEKGYPEVVSLTSLMRWAMQHPELKEP